METKKPASNNSLLAYFAITLGFSWFFWLFDVLASLHIITLPFSYMIFFVIGAHGPLVAALVMTYKLGGWGAVKALLKSGFKMRMALIWWVIVLVLPIILSGASLWLNVSLNHFQFDRSLLAQPIMILPTFIMMFFIGGSFQEEFGWRGFALPRLLEKWNPLIASLILGAVWGIWHLPLFFIAETGQYFMPLGIFMIMVEAFTILITWVYLRTGRNLSSALIFHTAINTWLSVFPPIEKLKGGNQIGVTYLMLAYLVVAIVVLVAERRLFFRAVENKPLTTDQTMARIAPEGL